MMASTPTISIKLDTSGAIAALLEASKLPTEVCHRLLDALEAGAELLRVHGDGMAAPGTGEIVMRLEPSEFLRGFLSAGGAGDINAGSIEHG